MKPWFEKESNVIQFPKPKAKANAKGKAQATKTQASAKAKAKTALVLGCSKCRYLKNGCSTCRDPLFKGKRGAR